MYILVLNAGSSSVKYSLFSFQGKQEQIITKGLLEKIGEKQGRFRSHEQAFTYLFKELTKHVDVADISLVGHRVVHGGPKYYAPTLLTPQVIKHLHEFDELAPLHNPFNLLGVKLAQQHIKGKHYAVFDTGFHHTLPDKAKIYAIPYRYTIKDKIQRYGFHGISHRYVSLEAAALLKKKPNQLNIVTCHLGNGASVCAIHKGESVDTSMGFTPLEGLVMGTRCGDIDPDIVAYLMQKEKLSRKEVFHLLEKESGLKGIAGVNDMREILARKRKGDKRATLAFNVFCYRLTKYIGGYIAALGGCDALVFTGGIGEHAGAVRKEVLAQFTYLGVKIDAAKNKKNALKITTPSSKIPVFVIPTREALMIARQIAPMGKKKKK